MIFFVCIGSNAALGAALIWFLTYAPAYFLEYEYRTMTRGSKYGVSIIINTAMAFAMKIVSAFEGTGKHWSKLPGSSHMSFFPSSSSAWCSFPSSIYYYYLVISGDVMLSIFLMKKLIYS